MLQVRVGASVVAIYAGAVSIAVGDWSGDLNFLVDPVITGTAIQTLTLTVDQGTVTGDAPITYTYQWYRNDVPILEPPAFVGTPTVDHA